MKCEPLVPPASSSAKNTTTRSRGGTVPVRARWRTAASIIASMSFMSTAPRPHTQPSRSSPANGSTDQSAALAGTTSRCPCTHSAPRSRSAPGIRTATLTRPGSLSKVCGSRPTSRSRSTTYAAACASPGPLPSP